MQLNNVWHLRHVPHQFIWNCLISQFHIFYALSNCWLPNSISCKVTLRVFGWCTLTICYPPISPRCSTPRCILAQSQIPVLTTCCFHLGHIVPWLAGWTHWSEGWATPGEPSFNPRNRGLEGQGPPTTPSALGLTRNNLDMAMDF